LLAIDPIEEGLSRLLDLAEALLKFLYAPAYHSDMMLAVAVGGSIAPEELGSAELTQLLERATYVLQEIVLMALDRQFINLTVDDLQLAHEAIQPRLRLIQLRFERLFVVVGFGLHEILLAP
jgi:hypothetical protein